MSETNESQTVVAHHPDPARFYRTRRMISSALLVFVVAVGLPIVGVPPLRHRLSNRVMALKSAVSGGIKPTTLEVGANHEPFPSEYERQVPPGPRAPELPDLNRVFTMSGGPANVSPALSPSPVQEPRVSQKRPKIESPIASTSPVTEQAQPQSAASTALPASSEEPELKYQRGKAEQEAYDVLLKSNPAVAALVQGKDPSLKFKSWDAAHRSEDTYWVRLKFQAEGNPDAEYIWQVKVQSNQATPLNYNARTLAQ